MENKNDHRENNIILAKSLNGVRMDLREKNRTIATLRDDLREEQLKLADMNYSNAILLEQIGTFKRQLDETFIHNTMGYMNLSIKIEKVQKTVMNNLTKSDPAIMEQANLSRSGSYHSTIQVDPSAFMPNALLDQHAYNDSRRSTITSNESALNSTFSCGSNGDGSDGLNTAFLCDNDDSELDRTANVTIRRKKKSYMRETKSTSIKKVDRKSVGSLAMDVLKSVVSSRGRTVKKINYNEMLVGEQYARLHKARKSLQ